MNEKVKQALEKLRELDLYDLHSEDFDNILGALNNLEELIKGKDEYIAKLCNDRAELKEELKQVEDFKYHYDSYKTKLANKLKTINCMQEEATTNYNLIEQLEDRNDRLVERLEKHKELQEFTRIVIEKDVDIIQVKCFTKVEDYNVGFDKEQQLTQDELDLVKKVVEKYGKR